MPGKPGKPGKSGGHTAREAASKQSAARGAEERAAAKDSKAVAKRAAD